MLFTKENLEKVLKGQKTMTRRIGKQRYKLGKKYRLQRDWYHWLSTQVLITRVFQERLGDISDEDIRKEGYKDIEDFKREWFSINGTWDPNRIVWVYEFKLVKEKGSGSFQTLNGYTRGWRFFLMYFRRE